MMPMPVCGLRRSRCRRRGPRSRRTRRGSVFIATAALSDPAPRQIVLQPADAVEVRVEPPARSALDQVEDVLTVAEAVERRRERPELETHLAEEQENVEIRESSVRIVRIALGPRRRLDVHQLLGRVNERDLVGEARQPVDAVDERRDLRVGPELAELLVPAVHVPDDRVGGDHALAVEANHETQGAVGRRVLRPEVEDHVAGVELDVHLRVGEMPQVQRQESHARSRAWSPSDPRAHDRSTSRRRIRRPGRRASPRRRRDRARASLHAREQREVLAERVTLELAPGGTGGGGLRVTVEVDAVHLPALALVPVGTRVDRAPTTVDDECVGLVDVGLDREAPVARGGLHVARRPGTGRSTAGDARASSRSGWTGDDVSPRFIAAVLRCRRPVDPGHEREIVALEIRLRDHGGPAPGLGSDAHDQRRRAPSACSTTRVAAARRGGQPLDVDGPTPDRVRSSRRPASHRRSARRLGHRRFAVGPRSASSGACARLHDDRLTPPALAPARRCRCPRSGSAPGASRSPAGAPRAGAGSRARRCRPG